MERRNGRSELVGDECYCSAISSVETSEDIQAGLLAHVLDRSRHSDCDGI